MAKLHDVIYSDKLTPENVEAGNKLATLISGLIPRKEDQTYDLEKFGKMMSDACFGAIGADSTQEARSAFINMLTRTFFEGVMRTAEQSPIASIAKGVINSQPVSDKFVEFLTGFKS
jgi:hypothetical protein